jgi:hypothetical protein
MVPTLTSVKNLVLLLACNVWVIMWTALLCLAILRPFKYGCSHVDSRWGQVSLSFFWHSVQLGFWNWRGHNICFLWLPIYCAYLNFRVWVICVSGTRLLFQKWLESFWLIWLFDIHLSTYGYFWVANGHSRFSCYFVMNLRRLRIAPSWVLVGQLASQYGVVRAMCIRGVMSGLSFSVPVFASVSAISFPQMPVCARTLCMWTMCGVQYIWLIMVW